MSGQTGSAILTSVREYIKRGWVIHPLSRPDDTEHSDGGGKRPLLSGWQKLTTTPDDIEDYLKKGYNIGLVCGQASGATLLDLDHELFLPELLNGFELDTLRSSRIKGRGHLYFMYEKDLTAQKNHDLGIEVLNDGSNAVLPPSIHRSGDVYRWNNPNAPIIKMPAKLKENLLRLFQTETELKQILAKCRHCFRTVLKRRDAIDWRGADGREYMLAVCTDLKAKGAGGVHVRMFAKLIYREKYDEEQTLREWNNSDPSKTWQCETLKAKLPSYIDLSQCEKCDERRQKFKNNVKNSIISEAFKPLKEISFLGIASQMQTMIPYHYDRTGVFWFWNHDHYEIVDETDVMRVLNQIVDSEKHILGRAKTAIIDAVKMTGRGREIKEKPKTWIHLKDVIIDIKTKEQLTPSPDYLLTSPIPYKLGESTDTPTIDRLFTEWGGADKKQLLYEICAYCMLDGYPIHRLFLLIGRGRNGKGQFREMVTRLVGHKNTTSTSIEGLVTSRFESARLYKKKLATIGETNFALLKDTAIIKMLTGGDLIPAEFKNKTPFEFNNTAKILISTNSLPQTTDKTDAFYSRFVIVIFPNQFPRGKDIVDIIPEWEYENLIAKCIPILSALLERGEFINEGSIHDKAVQYEALSNPISQFIDLCCIKDGNVKEAAWQIFEKFDLFCREKGFRKLTQREFTKCLKDNYEIEKKNIDGHNWVWVYGLKLKSEFTQTEPARGQLGKNLTAIGSEFLPDLPVLPNSSLRAPGVIASETSGKTGKSGKTEML